MRHDRPLQHGADTMVLAARPHGVGSQKVALGAATELVADRNGRTWRTKPAPCPVVDANVFCHSDHARNILGVAEIIFSRAICDVI